MVQAFPAANDVGQKIDHDELVSDFLACTVSSKGWC